MLYTVPTDPAARLALIIEGMLKAVACCGSARPIGISGLPVKSVEGPLLALIWDRLRGIITRFAASLARHALIRPRPPAVPTTVIARSEATKQSRSRPHSASPPLSLPRHYAWLLLLIQETAGGASQLRHFINDPEIAALIAADPRLGRILRPLCHMLGIRHHHVPSLYPQPLRPSPAQPSPQPPDPPPLAHHIAAPPPLAPPVACAPEPPPDAFLPLSA